MSSCAAGSAGISTESIHDLSAAVFADRTVTGRESERPASLDRRPWVWGGRVASLLTMALALILALDRHPAMDYMFIGWTFTNVLWMWYALELPSWPLLWSQVVYLIVDFVGLVHWWR